MSLVFSSTVETSVVLIGELWQILGFLPLFLAIFTIVEPCFLLKFMAFGCWSIHLLFSRISCWYMSSCPTLGTVGQFWAIFFEMAWLFAMKTKAFILGFSLWFTAFHSSPFADLGTFSYGELDMGCVSAAGMKG